MLRLPAWCAVVCDEAYKLCKEAYAEYEQYVLTALTFDDTEIDTFAEWASRHYEIPKSIAQLWEYRNV